MTAEASRLDETRENGVPWRQWWPHLSERQWGTVREDYGEDGNAWDYFSHDQARSRAYHWGADGLAGISGISPPDMVWLRGDAFHMGSDRHYPEEPPVHHLHTEPATGEVRV